MSAGRDTQHHSCSRVSLYVGRPYHESTIRFCNYPYVPLSTTLLATMISQVKGNVVRLVVQDPNTVGARNYLASTEQSYDYGDIQLSCSVGAWHAVTADLHVSLNSEEIGTDP